MLGTAIPLVISSHTEIIDATSTLGANLQFKLISTIFGIADPLAEEPYALEAKKAEALPKEAKARALGASQKKLCALEK